MRIHRKFICCLTVIFFSFLPAGCQHTEPIQQSGFYFDTVISITLYDTFRKEELEHCFELADLYEQYFSAKIADSDISKINAASGKPVRVHEETLALIKKGLAYAQLSEGKFDITIGKLTALWDFHADDPAVPDADAIAKAAALVDYRNVIINGSEVALADPDAALDLGGIAKGFIADQMKEYLLSQGIESGLINLGGNVLAIGEKENGDAYRIAIQKPFDVSGAAAASIQIKDQTVVTSGIYERYFERNGRIYHHILDTETGYPYDNGLMSVSIICDSSADGDGLSTTCFALGLERGMELVESLEDVEAIFITSDQKLHSSSGMGTRIPLEAV